MLAIIHKSAFWPHKPKQGTHCLILPSFTLLQVPQADVNVGLAASQVSRTRATVTLELFPYTDRQHQAGHVRRHHEHG